MKKLGLLYIILASTLWGTSGLFVDRLAPFGVTSLQMTFIRGFVSLLCMGIFALIADRNLFKTNLKEVLFFAGSGLSFYLTASCYFQSIQMTSVSTAVILMYTAPIYVMIYSVAFLGEKLTKLKTVGVVGMLLGCCLISGIVGGLKFNAVGIAIGFLSGITYASYNILTKIEMQKGINPVKANLYCFFFSVPAGLLFSKPAGIIDCIGKNPTTVILLCVGVGVFTCILPYLFYTLGLKELPAGTASSLGILEPLAATILSVIVLGEKLSIHSIIGIVLILGSVFILSKEVSSKDVSKESKSCSTADNSTR